MQIIIEGDSSHVPDMCPFLIENVLAHNSQHDLLICRFFPPALELYNNPIHSHCPALPKKHIFVPTLQCFKTKTHAQTAVTGQQAFELVDDHVVCSEHNAAYVLLGNVLFHDKVQT
jgi:hypothetical protein